MPDLATDDDLGSISAPGFRLEFARSGDRWTHALRVGEGLTRVAWPIESDPARDDPARVVSPAYQDLRFQEGPGGEVRALLVGQSGPHHFSAVFAVREGPGEVVVSVDVADRCRAEVAAWAATYWVDLPLVALRDAGPAGASWEPGGPGTGRLAFEAEPPARVGLAEGGRRASRVQAEAPIVPGASTHRCVYRWRWSSPTAGTP